MPVIDGGRIVVTLEGRDTNLSQLITRIETQMQRGIVQARQYDTTLAQVTASQARQESATLSYAQSLARGASASGDYAGAQRILSSALQQVTPNTTAASNAVNQLQRTIDQATLAQTRQNQSFTNAAASFNKLIGAYFAVSTAAQAFSAVIATGNQLEKQQALLRGLSGSTEEYAENLAAARAQQQKFGGSLAENIEGVANFANLSRRTGIEIGRLTELARGLATIDPAQGFKGAGIALKEFFSGDITSLARRFEIPRDELNAIKEIADQSERLSALEAVLARYGVTHELIAAQANTTAVAYEKLGGAATDALASIGQALAQGLEPTAAKATDVLQEVTNGINALRTAGDTKLQLTAGFVEASASAEEFNSRIQTANQQITDGLKGVDLGLVGTLSGVNLLSDAFAALAAQGLQFDQINQAQFEFIKQNAAVGANVNATIVAVQSLQSSMVQLDQGFEQVGESAGFTREQLDVFQQAMLLAASTGEEGAAIARAMAIEVLNGATSIEEGTFKLQAYSIALAENAARQQEKTQAEQLAAAATQEHTTALGQSALEAQNASIESARLKSLQEGLASISGAVANGHLTAAEGAAILASKYSIATAEAERLINAQLRLSGIQSAVTASTPRRRGQEGGLLGNVGADNRKAAVTLDFLESQKRRQQELLQAEIALARAKGNTADAINLLRKSQQGLNKDSAEFKKIEADILNLEKSGKRGGGGGGAKSPKLTENEKLHNQLAAQEDKFNAQMEDAERDHQQKLLDIIEEFNKKQLETQKENEVLKRRSRFDFYSNLNTSSLNPIDRQAFAAAYEEAFAEAQRIAQSGRAKLAQEFLELRKRQIEELQELAQEAQDIQSSDVSKDEKNKQLRELEERRKLLLDAQEEERKQLLEGGDTQVNEVNERIAEENKAYEQQTEQIATQAGRAADAKIAAAERAKKVVSEENKLYADQIALLEQIQAKNGGRPIGVGPASTEAPVPTTPAGQAPVPVDVTQPIPIATDTPIPIQPPEALVVRQLDLFIVRDQGVIDALTDQTIRLESKLDIVAVTVNNLGVTLGGKIDGVRNAIGQIKAVKP